MMIKIGMTRSMAVAAVISLMIVGAVGGSAEHSSPIAQGQESGAPNSPVRPGSAEEPSLPKTPREIVKVMYYREMPYHQLAKSFKQDSLPEFFAILEDDNASGIEREHALGFIVQLNGKNDDQAVEKLLAYIKRPVDWAKWRQEKSVTMGIVAAKWRALDTIGFIGGDHAERILKDAMTPGGASELSKVWLPGFPDIGFKRQSVLDNLRGLAANGLVYSNKPETRKLVELEYEKEKLRMKNPGQTSTYYSSQLVDAMVKMDVVKEIGLEGYAALFDGNGSYRKAFLNKLPKYKME